MDVDGQSSPERMGCFTLDVVSVFSRNAVGGSSMWGRGEEPCRACLSLTYGAAASGTAAKLSPVRSILFAAARQSFALQFELVSSNRVRSLILSDHSI
jgi:hypothetical protein